MILEQVLISLTGHKSNNHNHKGKIKQIKNNYLPKARIGVKIHRMGEIYAIYIYFFNKRFVIRIYKGLLQITVDILKKKKDKRLQ